MTRNSDNPKIPGYFVVSTAPINVDEKKEEATEELMKIFPLNDQGCSPQNEVKLEQIVDKLLACRNPELIISIHGYNTSSISTENRYRETHKWINQEQTLIQQDGKVFLGYRWPSEDLSKFQLQNALKALPILPRGIFFTGLAISVILCFALLKLYSNWLLMAPFLVCIVLTTIIFSFILLRLSVYFRDCYRVTNFGVPDLVELIRQIDKAVSEKKSTHETVLQEEQEPKQRIKLTFIGHSLGCLAVTNTIRILSDVFDSNSIGKVGEFSNYDSQKLPDENIGQSFCLGRLVLVAPDIPVETVIPRRANFLRSSLRRFEEAYIFSNEGDMVLRIASTIANYFSFPASSRINGYRLGNLTVNHFSNEQDTIGFDPIPGIVNLCTQGVVGNTYDSSDAPQGSYEVEAPYKHLEIRSSNWEHESLEEIRTIAGKPVANLITYFDCTDYVDLKDGQGILSYAKRRRALLLKDYIPLTLSTFLGKKNVHGGYFDGEFSKRVIYQLAFLGFKEFLSTLPITEQTQPQLPEESSHEIGEKVLLERKLWAFHQMCCEKQIQVVLAPERYKVDILKEQRDRSGY